MIRVLCTLVLLASTTAYRQDLAKLPNGNSYGLTLGHPGGNTKVPTKLASTFYKAGQTWNKAFCMADADGDGQSNGLEMGDPCCKWSVGQTPQFTTGLSDPNSAASTSLNKMPSCIMLFANANVKLQCPVCVQALQLDMAKPSNNAAEFILTSVKSCKDATQDDVQKALCIETALKNADQLVMDQKNAVPPIQSCMNLGLVCMAPTTAPATAAPTTAAPMTAAPTTAAPTTAAPKPTPPLPPRLNALAVTGDTQVAEPASNTILIPVLAFVGGVACTALASFVLWRVCKKTEPVLASEGDFHVLPDIDYQQYTS